LSAEGATAAAAADPPKTAKSVCREEERERERETRGERLDRRDKVGGESEGDGKYKTQGRNTRHKQVRRSPAAGGREGGKQTQAERGREREKQTDREREKELEDTCRERGGERAKREKREKREREKRERQREREKRESERQREREREKLRDGGAGAPRLQSHSQSLNKTPLSPARPRRHIHWPGASKT